MAKQRIILTEQEKLKIGRQLGSHFDELVRQKFKTDRSFLVATGVSERQFFRFKRGGNPSLQTIYLFAKALNVPLEKLFEFDTSVGITTIDDEPGTKKYYKERYGRRIKAAEEFKHHTIKIREAIIDHIRKTKGQMIRFSQLLKMLGLSHRLPIEHSFILSYLLKEIFIFEHEATPRRPPLTIMVAHKSDGDPGAQFNKLAVKYGYGKDLRKGQEALSRQMAEVYDFWKDDQNYNLYK